MNITKEYCSVINNSGASADLEITGKDKKTEIITLPADVILDFQGIEVIKLSDGNDLPSDIEVTQSNYFKF